MDELAQTKILMIETSTECCSVALACGTQILAKRVDEAPKQHAARLAPYVAEVMQEAGLPEDGWDAVAVSAGPGSYTGLRVGGSTAKGLCFGSRKPLIAVDTLRILALQGAALTSAPSVMPGLTGHLSAIPGYSRIIPMLDARRMEVYAARFDATGHRLDATQAVILDADSYHDDLEAGTVLFIGTGAEKFSHVCTHPNAVFQPCFPLAEAMLIPAREAMQKKEFEDVAYFEPFYLKEFVAGISKKSVL